MSKLAHAGSVTVNAYGMWQMILGTKSMRVEITGYTLRDLVEDLGKIATKDIKREVLNAEGILDPRLKIVVNGTLCESLDSPIADGDDVILFSLIDGG